MAEYIEREEAMLQIDAADFVRDNNFEGGAALLFYDDVVDRLSDIPAADVREVVRGKWKRVVDFTGVEAFGIKETTVVGWGCNVCGYEVDVSEESFNFCPNCGADMREES